LHSQPHNILVVRLSSIGDILLTTPLLRIVKQKFPQATLDFVTKLQFADLLAHNRHISQLFLFDSSGGWRALRKQKKLLTAKQYDLVLDLHKNWRSLFLTIGLGKKRISFPKYYWKRWVLLHCGINLYKRVVPVYQRYFSRLGSWGIEDDHAGLEFILSAEAQNWAEDFFRQNNLRQDGTVIALAPGAGFATKKWPAQNYCRLAEFSIKETDCQILLLGSEKDRHASLLIRQVAAQRIHDLAAKTSLMQTGALLQKCKLLVCNDSGLMHMATALNVPLLAIFGPTTKELGFFPAGDSQVIEYHGLVCRPCTHIGSEKCPAGHFRCMLEITPEQVWRKVKSIL
jgi:lipopolysaccharide heptosyltransferase II